MLKTHSFRTLTVVALFVGGSAIAVLGQVAQSVQPTTDMAALLIEVKLLRADLNRTAGVNARMQLLTARLSLQEQRISTLWRQINELDAPVAKETNDRVVMEDQLKMLESSVQQSPPEQRNHMQGMIADLKRTLPRQQAREQQLRSQVTDLQTQITAEQNRWNEFNSRLDELERSMNETAR